MDSDGEWGVCGKVKHKAKPADNCQFHSLFYTFSTLFKKLFIIDFHLLLIMVHGASSNF